MRTYRLLLDPAATETQGGGATTETKETATTTAKETPTPDPTEGFKAALGKHNNDALAFARESHATAESLRTQLAAVQAKLPKDGAVVLAGDDAEAWKAYKALGKPEVLKTTVEEHGTLKTQVAQRARLDLYGKIAEAHVWNAAALADVPGIDGMDLTLKDGTRNGKPAKIAHLRETTKDGDKEVVKETPLEKHIRDTKPHLMPALTAGQAGASRTQGSPVRQPQKPAANPGVEAATTGRQRPLARW